MIRTRLRVLSATYGPAEGRRLPDGRLVDYGRRETHAPHSRDVLPFLKALVCLSRGEDDEEDEDDLFGDDDFDGEGEGTDVRPDDENDAGDFRGSETMTEGDVGFVVRPNRNLFAPMDGRPMNAVFGDPCPGVTKLLRVEYLFLDYFCSSGTADDDDIAENGCDVGDCDATNSDDDGGNDRSRFEGGRSDSNGMLSRRNDGRRRRRRHYRCKTSRVFRSTFREHERVLLKRQDPLFRLITDDDDGGGTPREMDPNPNGVGPETATKIDDAPGLVPVSSSATPQSSTSSLSVTQSNAQSLSSSSKQWKLAPTTSEITLPIVLPFLTVRQRAQCQLVCGSWRDIVLERGVATVVDVNDAGLFPRDLWTELYPVASFAGVRVPQSPFGAATSVRGSGDDDDDDDGRRSHPSRALLRGLLDHSHSSLESLVLNDFLPLRPAVDLHPSLPHLRKLKRLDISRVPSVTDDTLDLISTFVGKRLEVLYMKGLRGVSNDGVVRLVRRCGNLRVLDVSQVSQLDDEAGTAIGRHLTKLRVFSSKDCYKLTNRSVDLITRNRNLIQGTFWGCVRLTRVRFRDGPAEDVAAASAGGAVDSSPWGGADDFSASPRPTTAMPRPSSFADLHPPPTQLTLLNLWGCHNLTDDAAAQMTDLPHLRSLCVSECHRLTDRFVSGVARSLNRLLHLQLRYLRRITDESLEAVARGMPGLYSLDVSFCTRLTVEGLARFLTDKCASLSELRLYSCRQLDVEGGSSLMNGGNIDGGDERGGGRQLVRTLRSLRGRSTLSFLDLRECQHHEPFARDELFLNGMAELGFDETLRGLFARPARWNGEVRRRLAANLADAGGGLAP